MRGWVLNSPIQRSVIPRRTLVSKAQEHIINAGLAEIRKRRLLMWILMLGYLPGMALLSWVFAQIFTEAAGITVPLVWLAVLSVSIVRAGRAKCPQCGGLFHARTIRRLGISRPLWRNPLTQQCLNCGLRLR